VCGKAGQDPALIPWSRRYMYDGSIGDMSLTRH
jgi:hypothetical protein